METTIEIPIGIRVWPARAWVLTMRLAQYVIGSERAERWATSGIKRLVWFRIGRGPWQRVPREAFEP